MSILSVACIIVELLYLINRFPLAIAPRKTAKFYRFMFSTNTSSRIKGDDLQYLNNYIT